jgi:hypothetical protein
MQAIANDYAPSHSTIGINDTSLIYGGVFDIAGTWAENNHISHRKGLSVDVQYHVGGGGYSITDLSAFTAIVQNYSGVVSIHSPGTRQSTHSYRFSRYILLVMTGAFYVTDKPDSDSIRFSFHASSGATAANRAT